MFPGRNQSHKSLLVARFLGWLMGELVEKKHSHTDALEATFERDDLSRYYNMFDQVNRKLEQLEFTKDKAGIEIERTDEAELPKVPNILRRGLNETFTHSGDSGIRESKSARTSCFGFAPQGGGRWLGVVSNSRKTSDGSSMKNARATPVTWFATRC